VASYLLDYKAYYTPYKKIKRFNLKSIKYRVYSIAALSRPGERANLAHNTEYLFFEP
jgi:hypothetical protein